MRRPVLRLASVLLVGLGALVAAGATVSAQTTTTTTSPATTATTTPASTAAPIGTTTTTGVGTTTTTTASVATTEPLGATAETDSGSGIPWVPIAIAVAAVVVLVALVVTSRRRATARRAATQWRHEAADATAEAGAVARALSQGAAPTGQVAQQILTSLRTFEALTDSAPDASTRSTVDRGRRALQTLGLAIDADYRLRRTQPDPAQLTRSQESVRQTAEETDHALRDVYRAVTDIG